MLISEPLIIMIHSGVRGWGYRLRRNFLEADGEMDLPGFRMWGRWVCQGGSGPFEAFLPVATRGCCSPSLEVLSPLTGKCGQRRNCYKSQKSLGFKVSFICKAPSSQILTPAPLPLLCPFYSATFHLISSYFSIPVAPSSPGLNVARDSLLLLIPLGGGLESWWSQVSEDPRIT